MATKACSQRSYCAYRSICAKWLLNEQPKGKHVFSFLPRERFLFLTIYTRACKCIVCIKARPVRSRARIVSSQHEHRLLKISGGGAAAGEENKHRGKRSDRETKRAVGGTRGRGEGKACPCCVRSPQVVVRPLDSLRPNTLHLLHSLHSRARKFRYSSSGNICLNFERRRNVFSKRIEPGYRTSGP